MIVDVARHASPFWCMVITVLFAVSTATTGTGSIIIAGTAATLFLLELAAACARTRHCRRHRDG